MEVLEEQESKPTGRWDVGSKDSWEVEQQSDLSIYQSHRRLCVMDRLHDDDDGESRILFNTPLDPLLWLSGRSTARR